MYIGSKIYCCRKQNKNLNLSVCLPPDNEIYKVHEPEPEQAFYSIGVMITLECLSEENSAPIAITCESDGKFSQLPVCKSSIYIL